MNAIVFVLRGCPAGGLGAYGNEAVGTPHLDRLAAEAVVFDRHVSDCPDPDAACRAWRTGRHQVPPPPDAAAREPPDGPDLLNELRAAGVRAVLVRANHAETDVPGFSDGWDEVIDARPRAEDDSPLRELARLFPRLLARVKAHPRWLLWVETDRLIPPWDVPPDVFEAYVGDAEEPVAEEADEADDDDPADGETGPVAEAAQPPEPAAPWSDPPVGPFDPSDLDAWEWLHASFAAVATALDAELGGLFEELRSAGLDESAAWLVTSDFGWPLGEHGQVGPHRPWLHEELVHVPLLVRLPGAAEAGRRVSALTQPADLMPTLRDLCGLPAVITQGQSLRPLWDGSVAELRPHAVSGLVLGNAAEWALRTSEWAYLMPAPSHPADDPPRAGPAVREARRPVGGQRRPPAPPRTGGGVGGRAAAAPRRSSRDSASPWRAGGVSPPRLWSAEAYGDTPPAQTHRRLRAVGPGGSRQPPWRAGGVSPPSLECAKAPVPRRCRAGAAPVPRRRRAP